jgi:hypothetical protein
MLLYRAASHCFYPARQGSPTLQRSGGVYLIPREPRLSFPMRLPTQDMAYGSPKLTTSRV